MEIRLFEFCLNHVTYLHFLFRYGKPEFTVMKKPPNSSARLRMRSRLSSTSSSASWRNSWSTAMPWLKRRGWRPRWPTLKMQRWLAGEFQDKLQERKKNLAEFLFGYRYLFMNGWLIPSFIYAWTDMTKRGLRVQFWKSMSKILDKQIDFKKSPIAKKAPHNMFIICRTL